MESVQIVKTVTKKDCEICDKLFAKLMKYESKLDRSILSNMNISGMHEKILQKDNVYVAYALKDNPIGYVYGFLQNLKGKGTATNRVFVDSLYVDEKHRNQGVGKKLLSSFEVWAKEKFGQDYEIELMCLTNNQKALEFYRNLGYQEVKVTLRKTSQEV